MFVRQFMALITQTKLSSIVSTPSIPHLWEAKRGKLYLDLVPTHPTPVPQLDYNNGIRAWQPSNKTQRYLKEGLARKKL